MLTANEKRTNVFSKRFIIGSVNQGKLELEEVYSAFQQNTIFLSGICEAEDYLDEPAMYSDARGYLKSIGSLLLDVSKITQIDSGLKIAELEMEVESQKRYEEAVSFLFRENLIGYYHQDPAIMTLSPRSALQEGDKLGLSYFSILEPMGSGDYRLKHDYQLERTQGPRYEKFKDL